MAAGTSSCPGRNGARYFARSDVAGACVLREYANTPCTILTPRARSMFGHLRRMQALDQFAYAIVETPVGKKCVQIGTHGDGLSAETEEMSLSPGAPQSWTPGACPADYGELRLFV